MKRGTAVFKQCSASVDCFNQPANVFVLQW